MKKFLLSGSIAALLLPSLIFAATYNDVTLTSAVLSVGGITVNVSGATLNQISVGAGSFDVILGPGSTITASAPNLNKLSFSTTESFLVANRCDDGGSSFTLTASASAATTTITVTPSSSLCAAAAPSSSGGSGGNGAPVSGGGGGGGAAIVPGTTTTSTSTIIAQLQAQIKSLVAQLQALLAARSIPASANAYLHANQNAAFKRDLKLGSSGADVMALQVYLNGHGFLIVAVGAGSPGSETTKFGVLTKKALMKFQKSVGISPASGNFGPTTRAYVAANP